ncbi:hypothetical protein HNY73_019706 [Argiope bruennichi]|uniref:Uncharacterized protein n=1 Tax=Argiope bruennichi TaxID=94029 RepID=A0A8T0E6W0_ARGBR|nr:hypothetical protein HNY73_019706 [Argiope bruennichi]
MGGGDGAREGHAACYCAGARDEADAASREENDESVRERGGERGNPTCNSLSTEQQPRGQTREQTRQKPGARITRFLRVEDGTQKREALHGRAGR